MKLTQTIAYKDSLPRISALALAIATSAVSPTLAQNASQRGPELPSPICDKISAREGTRLSSQVYALGVQIYRWSGTNWAFVGPEATLYSDPCYETPVGIHYAGPIWEANDGSFVKAARIDDCTPFRGAIPWLLLGATANSAEGKYARVTHIQRVNTIGGTAPATAGQFIGDEARVPYTTEYYFYREANP